MKYRDIARETVARLHDLGMTPIFPNLDHGSENKDYAETAEEKKQFALEHYAGIDEADAVYLLTPNGYMGTSMKLELGYAIAKNKPIYFSEPTNDIGLDCYVEKFIPLDGLGLFKDEAKTKPPRG